MATKRTETERLSLSTFRVPIPPTGWEPHPSPLFSATSFSQHFRYPLDEERCLYLRVSRLLESAPAGWVATPIGYITCNWVHLCAPDIPEQRAQFAWGGPTRFWHLYLHQIAWYWAEEAAA